MKNEKALLILRLEGLFQSWGETSKWDYRDSSDFPTKSGIVGLIGCAMGEERESPVLVELSQDLTIAVRADREGIRVMDFQTVTGNPLLNAAGKPRSLGNTIISNHVYIQDACFTVFLEMEEFWHARIVKALRDPRWCVFLGRKNCVPSRPVLECESPDYISLHDALVNYPAASRAEYPMAYETEEEDIQLSNYTRMDQIMEGYRSFSNRRVWRGIIKGEENVSMEV